jgi:hypothetical protein
VAVASFLSSGNIGDFDTVLSPSCLKFCKKERCIVLVGLKNTVRKAWGVEKKDVFKNSANKFLGPSICFCPLIIGVNLPKKSARKRLCTSQKDTINFNFYILFVSKPLLEATERLRLEQSGALNTCKRTAVRPAVA